LALHRSSPRLFFIRPRIEHYTLFLLIILTPTQKLIFDYHDGDIYWCTADIGWVTGHSYIVYGPLCNGATSVMFEGVPNYPDFGRFWAIVEKYRIYIFYTAPTAIRALAKEGDSWVKKHDISSIRLLGSGRCDQCVRPPHGHRQGRVGSGFPSLCRRIGGGRLSAPGQGAVDLRVRDA
jgi:hypothetical protein